MRSGTYRKQEELMERIRKLGKLAVAFSGGVDSAYLAWTAHEALGDDLLAVTAHSAVFPQWERKEAQDFCQRYGIRQIEFEADELNIPGFSDNPPDRCYICKKELFGNLVKTAAENGFPHVADGSNVDDLSDYRPGMRALREMQILSPLQEAGLTKAEIRELSEAAGLPTWSKPSFACLASRFVYGETITEEKLRMVGSAEQLLLDLGFTQMRVRIHGDMARIEVLPDDLPRLLQPEIREKITTELRAAGFSYVTADLEGYRTGSMNRSVLRGPEGVKKPKNQEK